MNPFLLHPCLVGIVRFLPVRPVVKNDSPLACRPHGRGYEGYEAGDWVMEVGRYNLHCGQVQGLSHSPTQKSRASEPVPSGSQRVWAQPMTSEAPLRDTPAPAGQRGPVSGYSLSYGRFVFQAMSDSWFGNFVIMFPFRKNCNDFGLP